MENQKKVWLVIIALVFIGAVIIAVSIQDGGNRRNVQENNNGLEDDSQIGLVEYTDGDRLMFEAYLRDNLSTLSPEKEVLGGTFYLTGLVWTTENTAIIEYEDGHIALRARVGFSFTDEMKSEIQNDYFLIIPLEEPVTSTDNSEEASEAESVSQETPIIESVIGSPDGVTGTVDGPVITPEEEAATTN